MTHDRPFDDRRLELEWRRSAAAQRVRVGALLLAHVPVGVMLAAVLASFPGELAMVAALMIGGAAVVIGPIAGLSMVVGGAVEHRRLARPLTPTYLLPAARIVVRER